MADLRHKLRKYKTYLQAHPNGGKVLQVLRKLSSMPMSISSLQETDIGKIVNSFRKFEGDIGVRAKSLVTQWKELVREEATGHHRRADDQEADDEEHDENDDDGEVAVQSDGNDEEEVSHHDDEEENQSDQFQEESEVDDAGSENEHQKNHHKNRFVDYDDAEEEKEMSADDVSENYMSENNDYSEEEQYQKQGGKSLKDHSRDSEYLKDKHSYKSSSSRDKNNRSGDEKHSMLDEKKKENSKCVSVNHTVKSDSHTRNINHNHSSRNFDINHTVKGDGHITSISPNHTKIGDQTRTVDVKGHHSDHRSDSKETSSKIALSSSKHKSNELSNFRKDSELKSGLTNEQSSRESINKISSSKTTSSDSKRESSSKNDKSVHRTNKHHSYHHHHSHHHSSKTSHSSQSLNEKNCSFSTENSSKLDNSLSSKKDSKEMCDSLQAKETQREKTYPSDNKPSLPHDKQTESHRSGMSTKSKSSHDRSIKQSSLKENHNFSSLSGDHKHSDSSRTKGSQPHSGGLSEKSKHSGKTHYTDKEEHLSDAKHSVSRTDPFSGKKQHTGNKHGDDDPDDKTNVRYGAHKSNTIAEKSESLDSCEDYEDYIDQWVENGTVEYNPSSVQKLASQEQTRQRSTSKADQQQGNKPKADQLQTVDDYGDWINTEVDGQCAEYKPSSAHQHSDQGHHRNSINRNERKDSSLSNNHNIVKDEHKSQKERNYSEQHDLSYHKHSKDKRMRHSDVILDDYEQMIDIEADGCKEYNPTALKQENKKSVSKKHHYTSHNLESKHCQIKSELHDIKQPYKKFLDDTDGSDNDQDFKQRDKKSSGHVSSREKSQEKTQLNVGVVMESENQSNQDKKSSHHNSQGKHEDKERKTLSHEQHTSRLKTHSFKESHTLEDSEPKDKKTKLDSESKRTHSNLSSGKTPASLHKDKRSDLPGKNHKPDKLDNKKRPKLSVDKKDLIEASLFSFPDDLSLVVPGKHRPETSRPSINHKNRSSSKPKASHSSQEQSRKVDDRGSSGSLGGKAVESKSSTLGLDDTEKGSKMKLKDAEKGGKTKLKLESGNNKVKGKCMDSPDEDMDLPDDSLSFEDLMSYDYKRLQKRKKAAERPTRNPDTPVKRENVPVATVGLPLTIQPPAKQIKLQKSDLMGLLPETSAHYRPWHLQPIDETRHKDKDLFVDPMVIASKSTTRTQVYSGRRHGLTQVKPLFDLCIQVLMDHINDIDYVGGIPYDILKPVLERATAQQLYNLEDYNPHLLADTDALWQIHCQRDFRDSEPDELETWRELYLRKVDEREAKYQKLKASMTTTMKRGQAGNKVRLAFIDTVVKPPREVRRQQLRHGTVGMVRGRSGPSSANSSSSSSTGRFEDHGSGSSLGSSHFHQHNRSLIRPVAPMMQKTIKMMKKIRR